MFQSNFRNSKVHVGGSRDNFSENKQKIKVIGSIRNLKWRQNCDTSVFFSKSLHVIIIYGYVYVYEISSSYLQWKYVFLGGWYHPPPSSCHREGCKNMFPHGPFSLRQDWKVVEGSLELYLQDDSETLIVFKKCWGTGTEFPYLGICGPKYKNRHNLSFRQDCKAIQSLLEAY